MKPCKHKFGLQSDILGWLFGLRNGDVKDVSNGGLLEFLLSVFPLTCFCLFLVIVSVCSKKIKKQEKNNAILRLLFSNSLCWNESSILQNVKADHVLPSGLGVHLGDLWPVSPASSAPTQRN